MNGKRFAWQGIAKLPFINEDRLLAEVAKIEHTLTEEEARRISTMPDMLFIALSHKLSPYIFSMDSCCKQLSNKNRIEVKEQIDPVASDGMNGYVFLCAGDPCPTIFRSPIQGMEDIMDNQVICAIYRLPDYHKHIARPPAGVKPPKKTVTVDDLQPEPILWHEDTGRKPWENERNEHNRHHNPHGFQSGRQLGDAAHRLVVNSLQFKTDRNSYNYQVYYPYPSGPYVDYPSVLGQSKSHNISRDHVHPNVGTRHYNYGQSYASSSNPYNMSNSQLGQLGFTRGDGRYMRQYHQPVVPHNRDLYVIQRPQAVIGSQYYSLHGGGYNIDASYPYSVITSHHHHQTGGWGPLRNQIGGRGHIPQHELRYQPYRR